MSMDISQQPVMEDEYIEMEPACANLPETMEPTASPTAHSECKPIIPLLFIIIPHLVTSLVTL